MKASTLEFLSDTIHDFKNPAIAVAGFAERAKKITTGDREKELDLDKLAKYLDIISKESGRMQDIAMTIGSEGRMQVVDLSNIAMQRFQLNEEVIP